MLQHFAATKLQLEHVIAVKLGRGCGSISPTQGHRTGLLMKWVGPRGAITVTELRSEWGAVNRLGGVPFREEYPANWEQLRFILWLFPRERRLGGRTKVE